MYAVHRGFKTGVFNTWEECKKHTHKFPNASFKKVRNYTDAQFFVKHGKLKTYPKITNYFNHAIP